MARVTVMPMHRRWSFSHRNIRASLQVRPCKTLAEGAFVRLIITVSLPIGLLLAGASQSTASETVALYGGQVTLQLPDSYHQMSRREVSSKWPTSRAPQIAFGNPGFTVTVAIGRSASRVALIELPDLLAEMSQEMLRLTPNLQWIETGLVEINGHPWARLVSTTTAIDALIRNEILATSLEGDMLVVNLNATTELYSQYANSLDDIKRSLSVTHRKQPPDPGNIGVDSAATSVGSAGGARVSRSGPRRPISQPLPIYPEWAVRDRISASVKFRIAVNPDGHVSGVRLALSSGYSELDQIAENAVRQWRYEMRQGSVEERMAVVQFRIRR